MNKVILIGRLTRDMEIKYIAGEEKKAVARGTLAVDRRVRSDGGQQADFISCVAFGKTAEFLEKYGCKGVKFAVEGRIQTGSYTKNDGTKVYTTDVVIDSVEFVESKAASQATGNNTASQPVNTDQEGFMSIPDGIEEELPFS